MYSQIYTYTLIRCLYNKGEDYLDSFYPLIVNILPLDKNGKSLETIQNDIYSKYSLKVPLHSLSVIANRAKHKGFVERKERVCFLTDEGVSFVSKLETERDEIRRINEFVEEAKLYLRNQCTLDLTNSQIEQTIEKVIKENIEAFEPFINGKNNIGASFNGITNQCETAIIDYLIYVEKSKPLLFKTLQDIIIGGIISTIIYTTNMEVIDKKLESISVFFDSNYIFSLMGLRFKEQNKPAQELFDLIKAHPNIHLRIFDFTVEEMVSVLKKYQFEQHLYPVGLKIDSLYSSLKGQGWTSADLKEFIVNVENKLNELGISVFSTPVDLDKYEPENKDRRSSLSQYKQEQGIREQNHDLAAIEQIAKYRKVQKKRIESCDALFLTSDIKLSRFNYHEDKHKENSTISEVIPDKFFTNFLWLKNPTHNEEIHLSSWISLNTRHFFIDRSVWKAFYETLKDLRRQGKINDTDISILIYDKQIQDILRDTDPSDLHNIEAEWILDSILKAKQRLDESQLGEVKELKIFFDEEIQKTKKEVEFIALEKEQIETQLKGKLADADSRYSQLENRIKILEKEQQEKDQKFIESVIEWKKEQENKSEIVAKRWLNLIIYSTLFLFFLVLFYTSTIIFENWSKIEPIAFIVSLTITVSLKILGKKYDPFKIHLNIYDRIFQTIYRNKLKNIRNLESRILLREQDINK